MSRQFTIITKDGSRWLRPVLNPSDTDQLSRFFQNAGDGFEDLPYIGSHPEGTAVDESEVMEVRQWKHHLSCIWNNDTNTSWCDGHPEYETRTAYTDNDDREVDYEKEMPHKKWPSTKYVARRVDDESHNLPAFDEILNNTSDDAKMNVSLQMDLNYWKIRAKAAEKLIGISPSDPKTYDEFCRLREEWEKIVKQEPK